MKQYLIDWQWSKEPGDMRPRVKVTKIEERVGPRLPYADMTDREAKRISSFFVGRTFINHEAMLEAVDLILAWLRK